ncbi:MAG: hypothetical protein IKT58_04670, partial [Oscillospiraceae bacterium]|nr:hypothetical protein [Oscillospiraceae bacterium]
LLNRYRVLSMLRRCSACYGSRFIFPVHTALSVSFADSSPKGRAKWLVLACKPTGKLKLAQQICTAPMPPLCNGRWHGVSRDGGMVR